MQLLIKLPFLFFFVENSDTRKKRNNAPGFLSFGYSSNGEQLFSSNFFQIALFTRYTLEPYHSFPNRYENFFHSRSFRQKKNEVKI